MKKVIIKRMAEIAAVLLCAVIIAVVIGNMQSAPVKYGIDGTIDYTDAEELVPGSSPVIENDSLALSFDENCGISVLNKETGRVWSSGIGEQEQNKFNVAPEAAISALMINYLDGDKKSEYSSYTQSVKRNQVRFYKLDDGAVRMTSILGERLSDDIIPPALTEKRYKEIYNSVGSEWQEFLDRRYQLFDPKTMTEADNPQEKYELYSKLKSIPLYIISDKNGKVIAEKTKKLFAEIGYTKNDYKKDNELSGYAGNTDECVFKISMDFRLENNDLSVTLPVSEMEFYSTSPLLTVTPLQFFTSSSGKQGSVLVPDSCGSVINFLANNSPAIYDAPVYGQDSTENTDKLPVDMNTGRDTAITMPVYFFTAENETVMTVIESGAANARFHINKDKQSVFAYTSFDTVQTGYSFLTESKKSLVCGSDSIKTDIKLRYRFFESGSDYVKDAAVYRDYLENAGAMPENKVSDTPLFLMESVGAVQRKNGKLMSLTSMSDAEDMIKDILKACGGRISLKMLGMNKSGAFKQVPGEFSYNKKLGSSEQLDNLSRLTEETGGFAYLQLNHLYYYNHRFADGFSVKENTAMLPDKSLAVLGSYNVVEGSYGADKKIWIISPEQYMRIAEDYIKKGFKAVGLGGFAGTVNSDYNEKSYSDRTDSVEKSLKVMEQYHKSGIKLAASSVNSYSYKYLSLIENMAADVGNSTIFDTQVPFCQMVLHGSIDYTVPAVNNSSNERTAVLKAIETGSGLHYILNKNIDNTLFETDATALFSSSFEENCEKAISAYKMVSQALKGLNNKKISDHYYKYGIAVTVYENGTRIYVNYTDADVTADGRTVPAYSWARAN